MRWTKRKIPVWKCLAMITAACGVLAVWQWDCVVMAKGHVVNRVGRYTVEDRGKQYADVVRERLLPYFKKADVDWPARRVTLIGLKAERQLEVWAENRHGAMKRVRIYPILGASGTIGPKLREGDCQVPEGFYRIESLNPNSAYHLSLRVNYPNAFDRARGKEEGREQLGGDIMIHGKTASIGCLAMGDEAAEDLFIIAALARPTDVEVILLPCDLRTRAQPIPDKAPRWVPQLYQSLKAEMQTFQF